MSTTELDYDRDALPALIRRPIEITVQLAPFLFVVLSTFSFSFVTAPLAAFALWAVHKRWKSLQSGLQLRLTVIVFVACVCAALLSPLDSWPALLVMLMIAPVFTGSLHHSGLPQFLRLTCGLFAATVSVFAIWTFRDLPEWSLDIYIIFVGLCSLILAAAPRIAFRAG